MTEKQISVIKEAQKEVVQRVNDMSRSGINVMFGVDRKAGVVTCVRYNQGFNKTNNNMQVGVSRCNKGDRFITPIGQIIALCRCAGKRVPDKYLHI